MLRRKYADSPQGYEIFCQMGWELSEKIKGVSSSPRGKGERHSFFVL